MQHQLCLVVLELSSNWKVCAMLVLCVQVQHGMTWSVYSANSGYYVDVLHLLYTILHA